MLLFSINTFCSSFVFTTENECWTSEPCIVNIKTVCFHLKFISSATEFFPFTFFQVFWDRLVLDLSVLISTAKAHCHVTRSLYTLLTVRNDKKSF